MKTFKYAARFLSRQKAFTTINIAGLALSLACCIVLSRYLHREFTVESHAKDPETILIAERLSDRHPCIADISTLEGSVERGLADLIRNESVETCRFVENSDCRISINGKNIQAKALMADSTFLDFFHYEIEGDKKALCPKESLGRGNGCWISRPYLKKIGLLASEAIGTSVETSDCAFVVAGIFDEPECKTIIQPDFIFAIDSYAWSHVPHEWIRVASKDRLEVMNAKAKEFGELPENERHVVFSDTFMGVRFSRWSDIYFRDQQTPFNDSINNSIINSGNKAMCWVLAAVLILILAVGMLNFVNLYLVYWQRRTREEGVRKAYGQKPAHLFREMWAEQITMVAAAVFLAWTMVELSAPFINPIMGCSFGWSAFDIIISLAMLLALPLLAIAYPLIKQLRSTPLQSLQERAGSEKSTKSRAAVLAFQYVITFSLLIMALWMRGQLDFLTESPAGFDIDHILLSKPVSISSGFVDGEWTSNGEEANDKVQTIMERLAECPAIEKTIVSDGTPISKYCPSSTFFNDKNEAVELKECNTCPEWFSMFNIKIKAGHMKDPPSSNFNWEELFGEWVVNEEALRLLGYSDIANAHARSMNALGVSYDMATHQAVEYGKDAYPIVGVTQSHYSGHRALGATPTIYMIVNEGRYSGPGDMLIVRAVPGQDGEALEYLKKVCQEICPEEELEYHWFRDEVERLYQDDRLLSEIYTLFSSMAIAICCLGLLGLSIFDIRQRFREVAIRKAHGARRKHLYMLLGKKYFWVLTFTFIASIPITLWAIGKYTETQAESHPVTAWIYILALLVISAITAATLSLQLEKACKINVAGAMKSE